MPLVSPDAPPTLLTRTMVDGACDVHRILPAPHTTTPATPPPPPPCSPRWTTYVTYPHPPPATHHHAAHVYAADGRFMPFGAWWPFARLCQRGGFSHTCGSGAVPPLLSVLPGFVLLGGTSRYARFVTEQAFLVCSTSARGYITSSYRSWFLVRF